jgi:hypothetical protein
MAKRIVGLVVFVWTLTFCAAPSSSPPIVVAPVASSSSSSTPLAIKEAHAAPPPDAALAKERMDAAAAVIAQMERSYSVGQATLDEVGLWNERLFHAQEDALAGQALVDAARARVARMQKLESVAKLQVQSGVRSMSDVQKATYYRASAEIDLARVQAR